jgi:23S rRNA (uracil1939-C5)-methyltransferase
LLALYDQIDLEALTDKNIRRIKLQLGTDGAPMLVLALTEDDAPALETDMPTSVNVTLPDGEPMNLIGDSHSRYTVKGHDFRVTAGSYFRANVGQLPNLIDTVTRLLNAQPDEAALDLYAGVGVFSAFIAPQASLVTLVESFPPAASDADENLAAFDNVDVIEGGVEGVLPELNEQYAAAVVDPRPTGLGKRDLEVIAATGIKRLVYVSSDAASLARDCQHLAGHGFQLDTVQPIDLSPQTYHVDTVALFTR